MKQIFATALAIGLGFTASMVSIESASAQTAPAFSSTNSSDPSSNGCTNTDSFACNTSEQLLLGALGVAGISGGIYALTNNHNETPPQVSP